MSHPARRKPPACIAIVEPIDDIVDVIPLAPAPVPEVVPVQEEELVPFAVLVERRSFFHRVGADLGAIWYGITSFCEWVFGAICLMLGLALLASLPGLQFLALGYFLEVGGRIGRTGRLRDGFIGIRKAARVGGIVLGITLVLLPLQVVVAPLAHSARIIDPHGSIARRWGLGLTALSVLAALHIAVACSRGGRLRWFLWPFTNPIWLVRRLLRGGYYNEARDGVWNFVVSLHLPYYFWLGLRGFAGAFLWLAVPATLIALGRLIPLSPALGKAGGGLGFLVGMTGAVMLMVVLPYVPLLQVHFAVQNRFRALFDVRSVRDRFKRAPWAYAFAVVIALLFAVPLYLFRIEITPREAGGVPFFLSLISLVFVVFIFPARLLAGWAYGRAGRRERPRHWFFRWTGWVWLPPAVAFYVLVVWLSQYTSWEGIGSLYEQHAFLLPVPFVGM
jgi:hypothetical protein